MLTGARQTTPEHSDPELLWSPKPDVFRQRRKPSDPVRPTLESWNAVSVQKWVVCNVAVSEVKFRYRPLENETPEAMPAATVTVTATFGERSVSRNCSIAGSARKSNRHSGRYFELLPHHRAAITVSTRPCAATAPHRGLDAPTPSRHSAAVVVQSQPV